MISQMVFIPISYSKEALTKASGKGVTLWLMQAIFCHHHTICENWVKMI